MTHDYGDHWASELKLLGGSIHQDDAPDLSAADELVQQAGIERYLEMLDALEGDQTALADPAVARAVLWSIHPIDDYGIYETAHRVLREFTLEALARAATDVLPEWLATNGDHESIQAALGPVAWDATSMELFLDQARRWRPTERKLVAGAIARWSRDDEAWEPLFAALGRAIRKAGADPLPDSWPEGWRSAAQAFRDTGRVSLAWTNERDFPSNFERVLAIMELSHGARWREVPDFLNPLVVRRRNQLPRFIEALAALPEERRERVIANVERARPDLAELIRPTPRDGEPAQGR